jgi:hypothetical protein
VEKENTRLAREKLHKETWRRERVEAREQKRSARKARVEETRAQQRSEMLETLERKGERDAKILEAKQRADAANRAQKIREMEARLATMEETRQVAESTLEEARLAKAAELAAEQQADALAQQERLRAKEREAIIAAEMEKLLPDREPKFGAKVIGGSWVPSPPVTNKPSPQMLAAERKVKEAQEKKQLDRAAMLERRQAVSALEKERKCAAQEHVRLLAHQCMPRSHTLRYLVCCG